MSRGAVVPSRFRTLARSSSQICCPLTVIEPMVRACIVNSISPTVNVAGMWSVATALMGPW